jgi:glutaredoxin
MADQKKIILWSREGCSHCVVVKNYLAEKGVPYTNFDVTDRDYLRDILETKYGARSVPVVEIGGNLSYEAILGTDVEKLEKLLENIVVS